MKTQYQIIGKTDGDTWNWLEESEFVTFPQAGDVIMHNGRPHRIGGNYGNKSTLPLYPVGPAENDRDYPGREDYLIELDYQQTMDSISYRMQ